MKGHQRAIVVAVAVIILWLLAFHQDLLAMVAVWQRSETFAHGYIVYPIAAWLIWRRRFMLQEASYTMAPLVVLPLMGCSALWLAANVASVQAAAQLAAVTWLPLALWLILGHGFMRICWFPCCYLLFAVPIGEELIPQLQLITADITVVMLSWTNIPVFREGLYIAVPGGLFEVAVACSGIRYLISSIALGTLFAHLQFVSPWRQLGFVVLSAIIPIFANGIRAYLIVLLAYISDMQLATGVDHIIYGWVFFGLVMFILFWIGSFWRQLQADPPTQATQSGAYQFNAKQYLGFILVAFSLIAPILYFGYLKALPVPSYRINQQGLATSFQTAQLSNWQPSFTNADAYFTARAKDNNALELYLALFNNSNQDKELVNFNHKLFNDEIWSPEGSVTKQDQHGSYAIIQITSIDSVKMDVLYWYQLGSMGSASGSHIKLQQAFDSLLAAGTTGSAVIMAMPRQPDSTTRLEQARLDILSTPALWQ